MPPTSKKLRGHIGLGPSVVRASVHASSVKVTLCTQSGTVRARILKFGMWFVYEN